MVTLRKRPAPAAPAAAPPPTKKKAAAGAAKKETKPAAKKAEKEAKPPASNPAKDPSGGLPAGAGGVSAAASVEAAGPKSKKKEGGAAKSAAAAGPAKVGDTITLEGFGGEIETNEGVKTTLADLVKESKGGVVLFTYPKASTPGCTKQVCFFRDDYKSLTSTGLAIYGLSTDSPKANTTFKTKQNLPYPLLCDPSATLIKAIGLKKSPSGTQRGVFVVDKNGKVLAAEPGGPMPTVEVVKKLVEGKGEKGQSDGKIAGVAAEVADVAAKLD